ncbi:MAG: alkaline phosphatase family protein [Halobacteriales archaeon]
MKTDDGPLLIVGWDSGTYELLSEFEADLEALGRIRSDGVYGDLRTVHPPGTVPGWPCITTGMNPGKINTQSLAPFRKDEFQPNTGEENIELWDVVDHAGGTSCVVNIPTVVDAYDVDGAMIAGFLSTGESTNLHPPDLTERLNVDTDLHIDWEDVDRETDIFTAAMDIAETRFDLVTALMREYDWDLFVVNFDAPDRIGHSRLKYMDEDHPFYTERGHERFGDDLRQCYARLDEMLDDLLPEAGNVFVISDHGMEPCHRRFNINDWLVENGYLVLEEESDTSPSASTRLLGTVKHLLTRYGLVDYVPETLKRKSVVSRVDNTRHISETGVDWDATTAYMSAVYGGIDVIADDRAAAKEQLTRDLESIDDPSMTVLDSRDMYHGPNIENVPDLFLEFDDYVLPTNQIGAASLLEPSSTGGKHSMDGIFAAAGPAIDDVGEIEGASVLDITPTALHLLGCPIPTEVDGDVLDILATDRDPEIRDLDIDLDKGRDVMSDEEKEEVMETLEDIGYM